MKPQEFKYRKLISAKGLVRSAVIEKESDLLILAEKALTAPAHEILKKERRELEDYIGKNPKFAKAFKPYHVSVFSPGIVKLMSWAARRANVGPMAAVAGAVSEAVGKGLLKHSKNVIVENGGDIFIRTSKPRRIGVYAGKSPFSEKIAIEISPQDTPLGVCTSAGTVGHSVSFGAADAVLVTAASCALADAAATAIGNVVKSEDTIEEGLNIAKKIKGLHGVLIIKNDKMAAWGTLKIVSI
jgi:ApbE superfamily uncharacterized protein (UPF0280 family)